MLITITDATRAGYCARGIRRWTEEHGLDFRKLIKTGIPEEELESLNCGHAKRIIALKKANS